MGDKITCQQCGKKTTDAICGHCGHINRAQQQPAPLSQQEQPPLTPEQRRRYKRQDKRVKILAIFWRYGCLLLMFVSFCLLARYRRHFVFAIPIIVYGLYTIVIAKLSCEHFIVGMQNAYRMKMIPYQPHPEDWLKKIKRDGIFTGVLFTVLGTAVALASYGGFLDK